MAEITQTWVANIENKKKLTLEDARFIFEQAEKFLVDVIDAHKTIIERTNTLLALLITILTGLVGFNISKIDEGFGKNNICDTVWFLILYLILGGIYLVKNIKPTTYMALGSQPRKIFVDHFFQKNIPDEKRVVFILSSEIERYQTRIEENMIINNKKWLIYRNGIYILAAIPAIFLLTYLVLVFI
ncbi:hypothetical protein [Pedobacter mendelii]|uniref:SMODS and SLOG-associating 2TM effector domain-containing protein n=1 Tax=Pedobacter mendelii TaxID=1908240 RepID=A0ABQ2BDI5_9SPHI|nr:hypothetical protein [Pedobacter mendelii]GGI23631.1 hypothetical protein GCM10008119_08610 [Pedobacter mendelii]